MILGESKKVVVFTLGGNELALILEYVTSIEKVPSITELPNNSEIMRGIADIRDVVTPIMDLQYYLYNRSSEITESSKILLVEYEGKPFGLLVDSAEEVLSIDESTIQRLDFGENRISNVIMLDNRLISLITIDTFVSGQESEIE